MACEDDKKRMCFTFIWNVENADYWWKGESIPSPPFSVEEIDGTNWQLHLIFIFGNIYQNSVFFLCREADSKGQEKVEIDCELAFLASDSTVLFSFNKKNSKLGKNDYIPFCEFPSLFEVFSARRSVFLSQDTLTVRCKMWKSVGEISKNVQCFARTRIAVEKRSFLWNIQNFSELNTDAKRTFEIKSLDNREQLFTLELFSTDQLNGEKTLRLKVIPIYRNIKSYSLQLSIVDASKNTANCSLYEVIRTRDRLDSHEFTLLYTMGELMEKKSLYLPKDVLSLLCECSFSFGNLVEEIEGVTSNNRSAIENTEPDKENALLAPKSILINDLKSMLNNSVLSDVKLKTKSKSYPAHKFILSVRSPVFQAMFSNNMKENINGCVDMDDLSDETVFQMLRYLYSADVGNLEWGRATELYEAADKYQILNLKDICSSFLKTNLHPNNACEALVLADLHQDENLKRFVQYFVLKHGKDVINSEEWDRLLETNVKLAAETMRLKFKE